MGHALNPSTQEAKVSISVSSGQLRLHESLTQKTKQKKQINCIYSSCWMSNTVLLHVEILPAPALSCVKEHREGHSLPRARL